MWMIFKVIAVSVLIAMLGSGTIAYSLLRRADTTGLLVVNSHRALEAAEESLRRALDADSGVREFSVTHDRQDLAPFERADQLIQHAIDDLEEHVGGQPERDKVRQLRTQVAALFVTLKAAVARAESRGDVQRQDGEQTKHRLDAIRATVREIRRAESDRLLDRVAADGSASQVVGWLAIVAAAIAAALVTAIGAVAIVVYRPGWWR